jgi:hypothetical protein
MRNLGTLALGVALAALIAAALPTAGQAYTPEEQQACQPDAFRLCGSEIPNVERVTACMVAKRAQLSPECKQYFRPDPAEPEAATAPPVNRPVNIKPKVKKPASTKPAAAKPAPAKKPATPKAKKPAKPAET